MERRRFLELAGTSTGIGLLGGCQSRQQDGETTSSGTITSEATTTATESPATTEDGYERMYEPLETGETNIGVRYHPFPGDWSCLDAEPSAGPYEGVESREAVNRHIDLLQGHGVDRVIVPAYPGETARHLEAFHQAELAESIEVELEYPLVVTLDRGGDLTEGVAMLRDQFDRSNYATIEGRPVLTLSGIDEFLEVDEHATELRTKFPDGIDGLAGFVEYLRAELSRSGTDPYLIADLGPVRIRQAHEQLLREEAAFDRFDGVTNRIPYSTWRNIPRNQPGLRVKRTYTALRLLHEEADVSVHPLGFPGFDRQLDHCSDDGGEQLARSPAAFESVLAIAGRYAPHGRLRVASFNNWAHGTQIEPGRIRGEAYGTTYLEAVKRFAQAPALGFPDRETHFVAPDGTDGNPGSETEPLETVQEGLARAQPGDTVEVLPGTYVDMLRTIRAGEPDAPITISGPRDATLRPLELSKLVWISHSHVHLDGLTIDGLRRDGDPDAVDEYVHIPIDYQPPAAVDEYLEDIVVKPAAVGNGRQALIGHTRTNHAEIGEFEVIGPAGAGHLLGDNPGHNGEIVYLGTATGQIDEEFYPWETVDQSRDVHVHHIDNSAGHPHAELVDVKAGVSDVTIEYCTDAGGSGRYVLPGAPSTSECAFHLIGRGTTLRWCDIRNGHGSGVEIAGGGPPDPEGFEEAEGFPLPEAVEDSGRNNAVYGNRILDNAGFAIRFPIEHGDIVDGFGPDAQGPICGNEYNGDTHGNPGQTCSESVPQSDRIGHRGGDSPWTG